MIIYVAVMAIIYIIFGLVSLVSIEKAFAFFNIRFSKTSNALNEFQAAYGGINTIIGILGLISIYYTYLIEHFLWIILITNLGYALGRAYAYLIGNKPTPKLMIIWCGEIVIVILSALFLLY
ncbi:MAG: hypothetical protein EP298_07295 [Gammaproteobacteria bacterium]|nr:MAG: hypothetical protein EP298_07295 [Gammaproteobacteria bacterium]UTW42684.1 hypothetical protein KFE69_00625 [bacterium SCSIO 12844]